MFGYVFEPADLVILGTLILLEGVLSFDNAAILAAMVRKLPAEQRRKALLYGIAGAYAFRILAILGVGFLIQYPSLKLLGGAYLLYLAVTHLLPNRNPHEKSGGLLARVGMSGFWSAVLLIEITDAAFALDQILVAVAMTDKVLLIIVASIIAILLLRISAAYMGRLMDWFPALERLAYVAVGFVGLKLVGVELMRRFVDPAFDVPKVVSVGVTLSLLVLPVVAKFLWERLQRARSRSANGG